MTKPILSIVSGTYNRLPHLKAMIESARQALPIGIGYEFVIVDGGSTDGTIDWLKQQSDVHTILHGELRGAIKAFCDGAKSAVGEYVVLANDDITFHSESLIRALVHLDANPTCGAVAFMDNRLAREEDPIKYKVQMQRALMPDGTVTSVVYAQVGMYRRWLGDLAGWWGADDPIMSKARTYGGDNYLSARIWELGYTVDVVSGVKCDDHLIPDDLRTRNVAANDRAYYEKYPHGPTIALNPTVANPQREHLRVLYLPIYEPGNTMQKKTKRGLRDALAKPYLVYEVDYLSDDRDIADIVQALQPHMMLTQFHDGSERNTLTAIKARAAKPDMLIINWNGDARHLIDPDYINLLKHHIDMQLVVNADPLPVYASEGINAAYWQIGYEDAGSVLPEVAAHDVVFLGNCYNKQRRDIEKALQGTGLNIGLYGQAWNQPAGDCLYDFATGAALYQNAKIGVGDTFPGTTAFVSNRVFQALAAGAFLLQQHSHQLEAFTGLRAGEHYIEWTTPEDLAAKVRYWASDENALERKRIAALGQQFVLEHFSFDAQVRKLFTEILPRLEHVTA